MLFFVMPDMSGVFKYFLSNAGHLRKTFVLRYFNDFFYVVHQGHL